MRVKAGTGNFSFFIDFHLSRIQLSIVRFWGARLLSVYLGLRYFNIKFYNAGYLLERWSWTCKGLRRCLYRSCSFFQNVFVMFLRSLKYLYRLFRRFLWPIRTKSITHLGFSLLYVLRRLIIRLDLGNLRAFAFSLAYPRLFLSL